MSPAVPAVPALTLSAPPTASSPPDTIHRLRPVVAEAAQLDIDDLVGWARVRHAAEDALAVLVQRGHLPAHLQLDPADPPAVVARTLAEAWRRATSAPSTRPYRY